MKVKLVWQERVTFEHEAEVDVEELRAELADHTERTDLDAATADELVSLACEFGVGDTFMADRQDDDGSLVEVEDRWLESAGMTEDDE